MNLFKRFSLGILFLIIVLSFKSYHSGIEVEDLIEKYTYPESKFIAFEGMQIHYRKTGSGPYLFLMHGVSSSLHTWAAWQEKLSKHYTIVSIDVPSFGLTGPHPKNDYSIAMYMRTIDFLTAQLEIDSMFIGGNSYGGYLAWNYALHQPQKVKKLLLLDAAGYKIEGFKDFGFQLMANSNTSFMATKFTPKFVIHKSIENVYGNKNLVTDTLVDRYYDLLLRKGNREGFASILQDQKKWSDLNKKIKKVSQPSLIIWGKEDKIIPVEHAYFFQKDIINSELKIYDEIGHVPMEEIPEETANLVHQFLQK